MKNVIISFFLFIAMIIGMIFSINYLNKTCNDLMEVCDTLEETISNQQWDSLHDDSLELLDELKDKSKIMSMFIDHQQIDHMVNELFKFTQYIKEHDKEESLASLHVIKFYIENIQEVQKINIQNIF